MPSVGKDPRRRDLLGFAETTVSLSNGGRGANASASPARVTRDAVGPEACRGKIRSARFHRISPKNPAMPRSTGTSWLPVAVIKVPPALSEQFDACRRFEAAREGRRRPESERSFAGYTTRIAELARKLAVEPRVCGFTADSGATRRRGAGNRHQPAIVDAARGEVNAAVGPARICAERPRRAALVGGVAHAAVNPAPWLLNTRQPDQRSSARSRHSHDDGAGRGARAVEIPRRQPFSRRTPVPLSDGARGRGCCAECIVAAAFVEADASGLPPRRVTTRITRPDRVRSKSALRSTNDFDHSMFLTGRCAKS